MTSLTFDLESNAKKIEDVTKIHCLSFSTDNINIHTRSAYGIEAGVPLMYRKIIDVFKRVDTLIGHNIIAYDLPVLAKLVFKCDVQKLYDRYKIIDTLVISRALNPDRESGHSLENLAKFLKCEAKVQQKQWAEFEPNMITRCESDVRISIKVKEYLEKEIKLRCQFIKII